MRTETGQIVGLREPAFSVLDVTFCLWRRADDRAWRAGLVEFPPEHPDPDGSKFLLSPLDGRAETYQPTWSAVLARMRDSCLRM